MLETLTLNTEKELASNTATQLSDPESTDYDEHDSFKLVQHLEVEGE